MEEREVMDHSKAVRLVSNSSPTVEQIELPLSTTQDTNAKLSAKKNEVKGRLHSSQNNTVTCCCCNISPKVVKCLEISGLITGVTIVLMLFSSSMISFYLLVSKQQSIH